eukprot:TRINITY_DN20713_c0_g1_i1.p1 TRINITY_DN20713_c0_g1~~TRINITY_DN20713_c0_g1_i1.p1  ORF type:complete len:589 (-),score=120.16 TRINITY_DN20713_c0_g1_i1:345-2111(-)
MHAATGMKAALGQRCGLASGRLGAAAFLGRFGHYAPAFSTAVLPWQKRPKMLVLGTGWAAVNALRNLDENALKQYNIMVCSPVNHFVNTPLLPSVTVGTLEPRSITEPIRNVIVAHRKAVPDAYIKFNEVSAVSIDETKKRVRVQTRTNEGTAASRAVLQSMPSSTVKGDFWLDYDVLVCAVGATSNTFGTPGALEHCTFLKTVQDSVKIRTTLLDCFETAAVYSTPDGPSDDKEVDRLLSFVVVGAGPTGVEIAAELRDFVKDDVLPRYSNFKNRNIKVTIVEMSDRMLGTYDKLIQQYARDRFKKLDIEMLTEHKVTKVNPKSVEVVCMKTNEKKELEFGMCVWASGIKPNDISLDLAQRLQGTRMLEVDSNLRVRGAEGSIFALGDCAKVAMPSMRQQAQELFQKADINKDGVLSEQEFQSMIERSRKEFPHLEAYLQEASKGSIKAMYAMAHDSSAQAGISPEMFEKALEKVDRKMRHLPPTAQVAQQQGEYLASVLNKVPFEKLGNEGGFTPGFEYNHMGSMAYLGGEHAAIDAPIIGVSSGLMTYVIWKGVYWGRGISNTMRINLLMGWAKSWFLGRDTSRL